jgi:hypothetical protein
VVIGAFIVIEDGKILKRSFRDCHDYLIDDHVEIDAMARGIDWIVSNMDDLRDINLQVFFCGAGRNNIIKRIKENEFFDAPQDRGENHLLSYHGGDSRLLKLFNKVSYHTASRIVINDGDDDDPEDAGSFDVYSASTVFFTLLYGTDVNPGHVILQDVKLDGVMKKMIVGMPELRWRYGCPSSEWS